jgi:hypothetical protein
VEHGQVAVEQDDVVGHDPRLVEGGGAVVGDVHRHALAAQPAGEGGGDPLLVFGDEDAHGGRF